MRIAIDLETACAVQDCPHVGKAMCANGHSLSPWHSKITVAGITGDGLKLVCRGSSEDIAEQVLSFIEEYPEDEYGGQNFKFDWLHLAARGAVLPLHRWTFDTQLAAYVLTDKIPDSYITDLKLKAPPGNHRFGKHSLKTLAPYHLGVEPFWEVEDKDDDEYVLKDAEYTLQLSYILEAKLKERGEFEFYRERQLEWAKMLAEAELRGITIDLDGLAVKESELVNRAAELKLRLDGMWAKAHQAYTERMHSDLYLRYDRMATASQELRLEESPRYTKLYEAAAAKLPYGVDYDSPKQMAWLLRDYYGYSITSLEGDESTGREVLERLADEGHEDVRTYLEWRKVNKLLSAFIPTYKDLQVDGVIHPIFNPDTTRTGRTSSERPNMQQVPPSLRPLFKARPGYKLIGYDAAAIEAKLIALYSDDPTLYEIIKSGISIHDHNTKVFFGYDTPYEEVKKKHANERAAAKNVGFALFYNAGHNRIRIAFAQKGYHLGESECRELHKRFKNAYKTATDYSKEIVRYLEQGGTLQNLLGRPLKIQDPQDAYMKGFNSLIQGSASDYLLHSAERATQAFKQAKISAYPLLFVHDYVAFEVEETRVIEADEMLKKALTDYELVNSHGPIHLEVDGGISDRWEK